MLLHFHEKRLRQHAAFIFNDEGAFCKKIAIKLKKVAFLMQYFHMLGII